MIIWYKEYIKPFEMTRSNISIRTTQVSQSWRPQGGLLAQALLARLKLIFFGHCDCLLFSSVTIGSGAYRPLSLQPSH